MSGDLAAALVRDDRLEDAGMHADDRVTCCAHQAWAQDCVGRRNRLAAGRLLAGALDPHPRRGWCVASVPPGPGLLGVPAACVPSVARVVPLQGVR